MKTEREAEIRQRWYGKKADDGKAITEVLDELDRVRSLLNTPELHDFAKAVTLEAAHQRERWPIDHDEQKEPQDWFWVVGYLAGKALRSHIDGDREKALHHTITTAALLANWHARIMRDVP